MKQLNQLVLASVLMPTSKSHTGRRKLSSTVVQRRRAFLPIHKEMVRLRRLQRQGGFSIDSFALLRVLRAHTKSSSRIRGTPIHALVVSLGFQGNVYLQTALIAFYSAMGNLNNAHRLFDEMSHRSIVGWTSLISAYVHNNRPGKALELFRRMQAENIEPDQVAITIALSACTDLGALDVGQWIHTYIHRCRKLGAGEDLILRNALINMYAKCGDIRAARLLFDGARKRDVTTWTSIIVGLALQGEAEEALALFAKMKETAAGDRDDRGIVPNHVTFIGVLMACSHAGLVSEGKQYWESMKRDHGLKPQAAHYGCMVDLLCRAGLLEEAYAFIEGMPAQPNAVIWRTLMGACSLHGNISLGTLARSRLLELEPDYAGDSVSMSNAYAAAGLWDEKHSVRASMMQRRAPGCSLIELGSVTHEFVASDKTQLRKREIQEIVEGIAESSRGLLHAPDCSSMVSADMNGE